MKKSVIALSLSLAFLSLAGCGETRGQRALSGGAIGAGAGALIGGDVGGAVVGGAVGALGGAATAPDHDRR